MSKRLVRTGIELEIHVNSQCANLLMQLPPEGRLAVLDFLRARIAAPPDLSTLKPADARQPGLFGGE